MFKLIKRLSHDYDEYYSIEICAKTGEIYFRPWWYKIIVIILELINILFYPITIKSVYYNRKEYSVLIPWYDHMLKGKGWVYYDYLDNNNKIYTNLMKLEEDLGTDSGFMGADVFNSYNPTLMNTYIAPKGTHFYGFGLKKGGKLLKRK